MSKRIPGGWKFQTLGEISSIVLGQSPDSKTYNNKRNGLPFFQGKADFGARTPQVKYWCSVPSKVAPKNSILLSVRAPVGDINFSTEKCCIGRGLASITATDVESEFLYQSLLYSKPKFEALGQGSTFEAINGIELKGIFIEIPPLPEQKKIASILTSVDEVIENTQKQIDKLQDLRKATINELLTKGIGHTEFKDSKVGRIPKSWADDHFEQFITLQRGNDLPVQDRKEGNVPIYGSNGIVDFHDDYVISREGVITGRSGSIGDVYYSEERCWPLNTTLYVKDFHGNFPKYVAYFLQFFDLKQFASGTGVPTLNRNDVHSQYIAFPPLEEQTKICKILNQLDKTIFQKTEKLRATQFLKKSLMQDLLTGKVRVKVN